MKSRFLSALLVSLLCAAVVMGQPQLRNERRRTHPPGGGRSQSVWLFPSSGYRSHVGIFPVLRGPRELGPGPGARGSLFGGHYPTRVERESAFAVFPYQPYGMYWNAYEYRNLAFPEALYSSAHFVEEWKERPPQRSAAAVSTAESILLSKGMSEDQVVRAVGSPLQRIELGKKTVWRYSGYSLLFEGGALVEIR